MTFSEIRSSSMPEDDGARPSARPQKTEGEADIITNFLNFQNYDIFTEYSRVRQENHPDFEKMRLFVDTAKINF